jgi:hypothetical protein
VLGDAATGLIFVAFKPAAGDHTYVRPGITPVEANVIEKPLIEPKSPPKSSTTNKFHVPLKLPVNEDNVGVPCVNEPGPGATKLSGVTKLVGL